MPRLITPRPARRSGRKRAFCSGVAYSAKVRTVKSPGREASMRAIVKSVAAALACAIAAGGPAAAETAKVRIASQFGLVYLPIIVAHEQGYFRKEAEALGIPDLEVTIHTFSGST